MRLSRPRLLLRVALLLVAAGFMAWRGFDTRATAAQPGIDPEGAAALGRIALVEWFLAALAALTALAALASLRQQPRQRLLHLGGEGPDQPPVQGGGPGKTTPEG